MVTIPLGLSAYKRTFAGMPEIKLINRFFEKDPTNQREHSALLARPGTVSLGSFPGGAIRGCYSMPGLFNGDLFIVSGSNLYRYGANGTIPITGTIGGTGFVYMTWMKGVGYEFMFVSDGVNLQYYSTHAMGTLTLSLPAADHNITNQVINIGGTFYSWSATVDPATPPAGTSGNPYLALLGTADPTSGTTADDDSLNNMQMLLNYSGIAGYNYSSAVPGANANVTATATAKTLVLTASADLTAGNTVVTTVFSGANLAFGAATLTGGGNQALVNVAMPEGVPNALASVSSYVLISVGASQRFYWLNPGEVIIDPLNFASKESHPDNIVDMHAIGDEVLITGDGSSENWYATGDLTAPFAPVKGRVYRRGAIQGTPVVVKDGIILVGDDGVVYSIGYNYAGSTQYGVNRISTNGIEERIRTALRKAQGLAP